MSAQDAARLRAEIAAEVAHLDRAVAAILERRAEPGDTTTYALALLLMNYYTGVEHTLQRVAALLGGLPPEGPRWHAHLLDDAALDIPGVRPPVLRGDTTESLRSLLRLRHALRNLYAWTIRRADLDAHVAHIEATHRALGEDLGAFCVFLDALAALP